MLKNSLSQMEEQKIIISSEENEKGTKSKYQSNEIRVYAYAKSKKISGKELMKLILHFGFEVKNPMSTIDKELLIVLDSHFDKVTISESKKDDLRIYEYAKSKNMSNKELIQIIIDLGFEGRHHMNLLKADVVNKINEHLDAISLKNNSTIIDEDVSEKKENTVSPSPVYTSLRVYEYAAMKKIATKTVINVARELGYDSKNHMSIIDLELINVLEEHFNKTKVGL